MKPADHPSLHDLLLSADFEWTVPFDGADSSFTLPATTPEKARRRFAASRWPGRSRLSTMARIFSCVGKKRRLKLRIYVQPPVEIVGVIGLLYGTSVPPDAHFQLQRHLHRIVDDNPVAALGLCSRVDRTNRSIWRKYSDELRTRKYQWKGMSALSGCSSIPSR